MNFEDHPDCLIALNRMQPYVDRELTPGEMEEVRRHLDECPPCAKYFDLEESFKMLVRRNACPERAPAGLVQRILQNLREA